VHGFESLRVAPPDSREVELSNVTVRELIIVPNMSGGAARASLKSLRLSSPVMLSQEICQAAKRSQIFN
jgi:hypothetical protein